MSDGREHMSLVDLESRDDGSGDIVGIRPFSPEPEYRSIFPTRKVTEEKKEEPQETPIRPTFRDIVHARDITIQTPTPGESGPNVTANGARLITTHYTPNILSNSAQKPESDKASGSGNGNVPLDALARASISKAAEEAEINSSRRRLTAVNPRSPAQPLAQYKVLDNPEKEHHTTSNKSPLSGRSKATALDGPNQSQPPSFTIPKDQGDEYRRQQELHSSNKGKEGKDKLPFYHGDPAVIRPGDLHTVANLSRRPVRDAFPPHYQERPSQPPLSQEALSLLNKGLYFPEEADRMEKGEREAYFRLGTSGSGEYQYRMEAPKKGQCTLTSPRAEHLSVPRSRHSSVANGSRTPTIPSATPSPIPQHSASSATPSPPPSSSESKTPTGQRCPLTSLDAPNESLPPPGQTFPLRPVAFQQPAPLSSPRLQSAPSAPVPPRPYAPSSVPSAFGLFDLYADARNSPYRNGEPSRPPILRPVSSQAMPGQSSMTLKPATAPSASRSISEQSSRTLPPLAGGHQRYYPSPAFATSPPSYSTTPTFSAPPQTGLSPPPIVTLSPAFPLSGSPRDKQGPPLAPIRTQPSSRTKRLIQTSPRKEAAMYAVSSMSRQGSLKGKERAMDDGGEDEDDEDELSADTSISYPRDYRSSGNEDRGGKPKKKHPCTWEGCNKTFTRSGDVDRHIVHVHQKFLSKEQDHPTRCEICGRVLSRKDSAKRHMMSKACGKRKLKSEQVTVPEEQPP